MKFIVLYFEFPQQGLSPEQELFSIAAQKLSYELLHASVFDFARGPQGEVFYRGELFPLHEYFIIARPNLLIDLDEALSLWELFESHAKGISLSTASISLCKNKMKSQLLFDKISLPTPQTLLFYALPPAGALQSLPPAPWILKRVHGSLGSGVVKVQDEVNLKAILQAISPFDTKPFILQEFIAEAQGSDRRLLMLGESCLTSMERQAQEGEFRANVELGARVQTYTPSAEELDLARRVMHHFQLDFAGIDIIPSSKGPLILEVNCNPGFKGIQSLCDFSIAESVLEYFSKKAPSH